MARFLTFILFFMGGVIYAATPIWTNDGPIAFNGSSTFVDGGLVPGSATSLTLSLKMTANSLANMVPVDKFPVNGSAGWAVKLRSNGDIWFLLGGGTSNSSSTCMVVAAYSVGVPVNIACTFTGGTAKIYVNGVLRTTKTGITQTVNDAVTNLRLGMPSVTSTSEKFNGTLEAVKVFSSALSDVEINNLVFNLPSGGSQLASSYPLLNKPLYYGSRLTWVSPIVGTYNVYIGENSDSISKAGLSLKFFRGNVPASYFDVSTLKLKAGTRYFWRIDVVNGSAVTTGGINTFIQPLNSANYQVLRSGLRNSQLQFQNQKTGRVAFLGGSITFNPGWRDSICAYLKKQFPNTTFDFVSAGIPSMGSTPAAFRMERDVISKGKIDLLFEEAAVNDGPSGNDFSKTEQIRAMEGIVRHAINTNPNMDVVFMYFADLSKIASYNANSVPDVILNHDLVAQTYALPAINLAKEVNDRIKLGEFDWNTDFVDLHPSVFGQGIYYRSIKCLLDSAWKKPSVLNEPLISKILPSKIDLNCYDTGYLVDISKADASANWVLNPNWIPTDGKSTRADYTNVPMLIGQTPDAILSFKFNGRAVGISPACGPDAGIIMSSIDGGPWKSTDLFTWWSSGMHLPWYYTLYSDLSSGSHNLQLKMSANKNASSTGTVARIRYFFVSGTTVTSDFGTLENDNKDLIQIIHSASRGVFTIHVSSDDLFSVTVYNSNGHVKFQKSHCINNEQMCLSENGIYFVETVMNNVRVVRKLVVH